MLSLLDIDCQLGLTCQIGAPVWKASASKPLPSKMVPSVRVSFAILGISPQKEVIGK